MEAFIVLVLVVIILLLIHIRSRQNEIADQNQKNYLSLKNELAELKKRAGTNIAKEETPLKATDESVVQWRPYKAPEPIEKIAPSKEEIKETEKPKEEKTIPPPPIIKERVPEPVTESLWDKWIRNNPDLEKFIGENLINKIGIAVLVLGIGFFVKYAIDQNWINEIGRVCIGITCGIIMIGIAHRLRNSYRSFSSVMAGGGIAVFYFTIAFAFHEYQLFSQTTAFIIMVIITAFAVALALLYDKIELAVIAVVGGFLAPFLVSNGSNNYVALFTYLLILNTGILAIAYFKKWQLLHVLSFFFTLLILGGWMLGEYGFNNNNKKFTDANALFFASGFYIIFLITALIHNLRKQKSFNAFDFALMIMITASYYAEGMVALHSWDDGAYQGIFTIALGIINLALAWYLYKRHTGDKNLLYLLIGLTVTFISLAAPVQLHGHSITLFWSAETVLLFWLFLKSRMKTFKHASFIILVSMAVSLLIDWSLAGNKNHDTLLIIFNNWRGVVTNIVAIISFGLYAWLLKKEPGEDYILGIKNSSFSQLMTICATMVLYLTCIFGINLYFIKELTYDIPNAYHQLFTYVFIAVIVLFIQRHKTGDHFRITIPLLITGFFFYLVSIVRANDLITGVINHEYLIIHSIVHWLADICLLYLLYQLISITKRNIVALGRSFAWFISILLFLFLSIECKHLYVTILARSGSIDIFTAQYLKAGLTIVWALFSFVLMWLGMKYKYKTLRIISLSIFSVALLKLFLFDITNISAGGKIAAFIMLGILLLVISFMYQRLKKIIIEDESKTI
ncbi:MAG: DUF2339 domain-containing protein [Ferruginibacter sp.]